MSAPFSKDAFTLLLSAHTEAVAREEAARTGFDIANEPHGLFRAIATVLASPELLAEAVRRTKAGEPCEYMAHYQARQRARG